MRRLGSAGREDAAWGVTRVTAARRGAVCGVPLLQRRSLAYGGSHLICIWSHSWFWGPCVSPLRCARVKHCHPAMLLCEQLQHPPSLP